MRAKHSCAEQKSFLTRLDPFIERKVYTPPA